MIKKWTPLILRKDVKFNETKMNYVGKKGENTNFVVTDIITSMNNYIDENDDEKWLVCNSMFEPNKVLLVNRKDFYELFEYSKLKNYYMDNFKHRFANTIVNNIFQKNSNPNLEIVKVDKENNEYKGEIIYLSDYKIDKYKNQQIWFDNDNKIYKNKTKWEIYRSNLDSKNEKRFNRYKNGMYVSLNCLDMLVDKKIYNNKIKDEFFKRYHLDREQWEINKIINPLELNKRNDLIDGPKVIRKTKEFERIR